MTNCTYYVKYIIDQILIFHNAEDIVNALNEKYSDSTAKYYIKEIKEEELKLERKEALSLQVSTVKQSSTLCVLVFKP